MMGDKRTTLGVDIGTSGIKIKVYDADFREVYENTHAFSADITNSTSTRQNPWEIKETLLDALNVAVKDLHSQGYSVSEIGIDTIFTTFMVVDKISGQVVGNESWMHTDNTSAGKLSDLESRLGNLDVTLHDFYNATGCPLTAERQLPRVLQFMDDNNLGNMGDYKILSFPDWILSELCDINGEYHTSPSIASSIGFRKKDGSEWYSPALEAAGIREDNLPLVANWNQGFTISQETKTRIGLNEGEGTVFPITGDGIINHLGLGITESGVYRLKIESTVVQSGLIPVGTECKDPDIWQYLAISPFSTDKISTLAGIATNVGGTTLDHFTRVFLGKQESLVDFYRTIETKLFEEDKLPSGPIINPHSNGMRGAPYIMRSSVLALDKNLTKETLFRSYMESLLFIQRKISEQIGLIPSPIERYRATGNVINNEFTIQMAADILGKPVDVIEFSETAAAGVAMLARAARDPNFRYDVKVVKTYEPREEFSKAYSQRYEMFKALLEFDRFFPERFPGLITPETGPIVVPTGNIAEEAPYDIEASIHHFDITLSPEKLQQAHIEGLLFRLYGQTEKLEDGKVYRITSSDRELTPKIAQLAANIFNTCIATSGNAPLMGLSDLLNAEVSEVSEENAETVYQPNDTEHTALSERFKAYVFLDYKNWWATQKGRYQTGEITDAELFPYEEQWNLWDDETQKRWGQEITEIFNTNMGQLRSEIDASNFRDWGVNENGEIGWLGPSDFLEETSMPYHTMYPGMPDVEYQHGVCQGSINATLSKTEGRHFLRINNLT